MKLTLDYSGNRRARVTGVIAWPTPNRTTKSGNRRAVVTGMISLHAPNSITDTGNCRASVAATTTCGAEIRQDATGYRRKMIAGMQWYNWKDPVTVVPGFRATQYH